MGALCPTRGSADRRRTLPLRMIDPIPVSGTYDRQTLIGTITLSRKSSLWADSPGNWRMGPRDPRLCGTQGGGDGGPQTSHPIIGPSVSRVPWPQDSGRRLGVGGGGSGGAEAIGYPPLQVSPGAHVARTIKLGITVGNLCGRVWRCRWALR